MRIRFNSVTGNTLMQEHMFLKRIELLQLKKQIEVLATFIPDEILDLRQNQLSMLQTYVGVLLYANFENLWLITERYYKIGMGGIYRLTATVNAYIGSVVETIYFYGGDVLKFTGSGILSMWKVMSDDCLFEILHEVVVCAMVVQQTLGHFDSEVNIDLRVKLTISCGNMTFSVIGEGHNKDYIIVGDALNDLKQTFDFEPGPGEVLVSVGAWSHMLQDRYEIVRTGEYIKIINVLYKPNEESKKVMYDEKHIDVSKLIDIHIHHKNLLQAKRTFDSNLTETMITDKFLKQLPVRPKMKNSPKFWIVDELRPFIIKNVLNQIDESQPVEYLTEMRDITIQYINIVSATITDLMTITLVDSVYKIVCKLTGEVLGIVHKVIISEKDLVIIVLFGLRGIDHELESQNALKSAFKIKLAIEAIEEVNFVSVSVITGFVYCGVLGHPMRREYNVIGGTVIKAAKFAYFFENKITCDLKTYKRSKLASFYFQLENEIGEDLDLDSYDSIFQYCELTRGLADPSQEPTVLIGRDAEFNLIRKIIYENNQIGNFLGVCIYGSRTMGKTAILRHVLDRFRNKQYNIASVELTSGPKIPYFVLSRLYRQLYDKKALVDSLEMESLINLPRDLNELREDMKLNKDDLAIQKYRILNYFRQITQLSNDTLSLIFIDNFEYIDLQSWEVLQIVLNDQGIRLIAAASFLESVSWDLHFQVSLEDNILMLELRPLQDQYLPALACHFLDVAGIEKRLYIVLSYSCEGNPGKVQTCLLHLINTFCVELKLVTYLTNPTYIYPKTSYSEKKYYLYPVAAMLDKFKAKREGLTLAAISLDLFDSFTAFQQLLVKTAAVLGDLFTRTLLIVALKYPSDNVLSNAIKVLFEEEVFDCGARYVYSNGIETSKLCCSCYFDEEQIDNAKAANDTLPKYARCKILHFKNKSIRDVAYDLLPGNQRKELHVLCTDLLESMANQCPTCLREPTINYLACYKFKDIMDYCNDISKPFKTIKYDVDDFDGIKDTVKRAMLVHVSDASGIKKKRYSGQYCNCKCVEILARVYKDLIYHSEQACHMAKRIFFSMQYGLLLNSMFDFKSAMEILTIARELCLNDSGLGNAQITLSFKRFHIGRIQVGLALANLELQNLATARNHLAIALRQYNIPTVSMKYKCFSKLLTRTSLVSKKRFIPSPNKYSIIRCDMGICLAYCAKLFYLEGNFSMAKMAALYSLYIFKTVNVNVLLLFDTYCTVLDLYRFCNDLHTFDKLQKYVLRDLQYRYAGSNTFNLRSVVSLMNTFFYLRFVYGDISGSIRFGYRVIDMNLSICVDGLNLCILSWQSLLLMYDFRIKDSVDVCKLLYKVHNYGTANLVEYFACCLNFYLRTGFVIEPFDDIIDFANVHFNGLSNYSWRDNYLIFNIQIHYLRLSKFLHVEHYTPNCVYNERNIKTPDAFRTLLACIETKIYIYLHNKQQRNPYIVLEEKEIRRLLKMAQPNVETQFFLFLPRFYCLNAWFLRILHKTRKSNTELNKALKYSDEQENILYKCYVMQLKNTWSGGFSFPYEKRPLVDYNTGRVFSLCEWAQFMHPLPLE